VPYCPYNIVYLYPVSVLRKVVNIEYLTVPWSVFQCRLMHLFVIIGTKISTFDIYKSLVVLEQCSHQFFVERCINGISKCSENVKKKMEVQFLCISSTTPQFHHHFLLLHKHIIAIMPLDNWCHTSHSHHHIFLCHMVYLFLHIFAVFRS